MKTTLWIFPVLFLVGCSKGPVLEFSSPKHDFGKLYVGDKAEHLYEFRNVGDEELVIKSIQASCGCTVAEMWVDPKNGIRRVGNPKNLGDVLRVQPGETGKVQIHLDTKTLSGAEAQRSGSITITTNEVERSYVQIQYLVAVSKPFALDKEHFDMGSKGKNQIVELTRTLSFLNETTFEISKIRTSHPGLKAEQKTVHDEGKKQIQLSLRAETTLPVGNFAGKVDYETNLRPGHVVSIPVYAVIQPSVSVNPPNLLFSTIARHHEGKASIEITCTDPEPKLEVLRVWAEGMEAQNLSPSIEVLEPGKRFRIDVIANAKIEAASFRGNLIIETNHPEHRKIETPYRGFLK